MLKQRNICNCRPILEKKNTKLEKQLPIFDTPVKSLQFFVLCTIFNEEKIMPWFYCNYIQLEWLDGWCVNFSLLQEYYVGYPYIDKQIIIRDSIKNINIIDFIISNVKRGWYTHLCLDEYFVPEKSSYKHKHYSHDNMVCGFNQKEKYLYIYGYCSNKELKLTQITFSDFEKAYNNLDKITYSRISNTMKYYNQIFMIKKNLNVEYKMDIEFMKKSMNEYLTSMQYADGLRMFKSKNDNKIYGIAILDKLINAFWEGDKHIITDLRLLTTVCEHCSIMAMRVNYLMENNYINMEKNFLDKFYLLEKQALEIKRLQLYYLVGKKKVVLKKIANHLNDMKNSEKELFGELLLHM